MWKPMGLEHHCSWHSGLLDLALGWVHPSRMAESPAQHAVPFAHMLSATNIL